MMNFIAHTVDAVNGFLWDYALLFLLMGTGIFYTICLKFVQIRKFGVGMKMLFGNFSLHGNHDGHGLSSFQALTTAIAARLARATLQGRQRLLWQEARERFSGCG